MVDRKKRSRLMQRMILFAALLVTAAVTVTGCDKSKSWKTPEELLTEYMKHIEKQEYEEMYAMLNVESSGNISQEDFIKRNSAIYEGIEIQNTELETTGYDEEQMLVTYHMTFDTSAGSVEVSNEARFIEGEERYELAWSDELIFPGLKETDKVRVSTIQAQRGEILDRNGRVLAGQGTASSVGIVPGRLKDKETAISEIAKLLEVSGESIENKLSAGWVKEDSFVPIKTLVKVTDADLRSEETDEAAEKEKERQDKLLEISGVMITDTEVRQYPLGEAASHLIGYVQNVTAEDLEKHEGEGYTSASVIGRSGMESLFEKELKGQNGCRIYIVDEEGNEKKTIAARQVQNGENIRLTIDSELQKELYEQFKEDESCSVAMNPFTGEVLALVSTPSFDDNDFILGMSEEKWTQLNEDASRPLYNRFRQVWCPGSTFKPIIGAIGLDSGTLDPEKDYGNEGLSWQKDSSWGSYYVTTLHAYEPVTFENALIYSDNIYFAKAALNIGADTLENYLKKLGFGEEFPFEITMAVSQYSNTDHIDSEIQLADSGYGQGQILINPLHLASIYTAFCNDGNVIKPYLVYTENPEGEILVEGAFSADAADKVLEGMKKVVNDPNGTGYGSSRIARREDVVLAGKTGTAELKSSKEEENGAKLGWFAVMTADKNEENPILLVSMIEDIREKGGSSYVVGKDSEVLSGWFTRNQK
ncbi:MAG: penicillin-binding transpeptidase domain-containing protein [Lachnospiraceae bacterium]